MFLDTSGLLCLVHTHESQHVAALAHYDSAKSRLTHNYVLDEFVALANSRGLSRSIMLGFAFDGLNDSEIEIVWVDEYLHRRGLELLAKRVDKTYSLCDGVSFVLMRERGIHEALMTDKHFEQEGLQRLLAP